MQSPKLPLPHYCSPTPGEATIGIDQLPQEADARVLVGTGVLVTVGVTVGDRVGEEVAFDAVEVVVIAGVGETVGVLDGVGLSAGVIVGVDTSVGVFVEFAVLVGVRVRVGADFGAGSKDSPPKLAEMVKFPSVAESFDSNQAVRLSMTLGGALVSDE